MTERKSTNVRDSAYSIQANTNTMKTLLGVAFVCAQCQPQRNSRSFFDYIVTYYIDYMFVQNGYRAHNTFMLVTETPNNSFLFTLYIAFT